MRQLDEQEKSIVKALIRDPRLSDNQISKVTKVPVMSVNRKRKKLDRIMNMFLSQTKITNDEVEKLFHVSDSTATRYLDELQKQGKIRQLGITGKAVFYEKI